LTVKNKDTIFKKTILGYLEIRLIDNIFNRCSDLNSCSDIDGNIFITHKGRPHILQYFVDIHSTNYFFIKIYCKWYEIIDKNIGKVPVLGDEKTLEEFCYDKFVEYTYNRAYIEEKREAFFVYDGILKPIKATEYFKLLD
jgi:hypothetical protein